ncbi:MAG TPA: DUF4912 domain-containing protein [Bacillota bacterium]|jgi:hypothetical protein|nr:DUF4912 domain-containing protein [Bacillota bacterium]HOL10102.1 DUF4912 domain-containing protein [Bacillota bacterium]HPO98301.1 DUF4912 domain-containing protein [Bacillota bacterium]
MLPMLVARYRQNVISCLLQDLKNIYIYWDFRDERIQTLKSFMTVVKPDIRLTLRLMREDSGTGRFFPEQEVSLYYLEPGNYYFRNLDPFATYYIEFGAKTPDGRFIRFFQSATIQLQPSLRGINSSEFFFELDLDESLNGGLNQLSELARLKELNESLFSWS